MASSSDRSSTRPAVTERREGERRTAERRSADRRHTGKSKPVQDADSSQWLQDLLEAERKRSSELSAKLGEAERKVDQFLAQLTLLAARPRKRGRFRRTKRS
jgi:hypothetical protein